MKPSILKIDTLAKRVNNARKEEDRLPEEMLPLANRRCGAWGHKWSYTPTGMKICTNHLCEVKRPYTPNECARVGRFA